MPLLEVRFEQKGILQICDHCHNRVLRLPADHFVLLGALLRNLCLAHRKSSCDPPNSLFTLSFAFLVARPIQSLSCA
jgi:hypothetical protein